MNFEDVKLDLINLEVLEVYGGVIIFHTLRKTNCYSTIVNTTETKKYLIYHITHTALQARSHRKS